MSVKDNRYEFTVLRTADDCTTLKVWSKVPDLSTLIEEGKASQLWLSGEPFDISSINRSAEKIVSLICEWQKIPDSSHFESLTQVERMVIRSPPSDLDFKMFTRLRYCSLSGHGSAVDLSPLAHCPTIEELTLSNVAMEDLGGLQHLTNLDFLVLAGAELRSLKGLEKLNFLRAVRLHALSCRNSGIGDFLQQRFNATEAQVLQGGIPRSKRKNTVDFSTERNAADLAIRERSEIPESTVGIDLEHPGLLIVLLDQSASMGSLLGRDRRILDEAYALTPTLLGRLHKRSDAATTALNLFLRDLIIRYRQDPVRCNLDIGIIGYGDGARSLLPQGITPLSVLAADQAETDWVMPAASGIAHANVAMRQALKLMRDWCDLNPDSPSPVVINITDDGEEEICDDRDAWALRRIGTRAGLVKLFTIAVRVFADVPEFPESEPWGDGRGSWKFSSPLPDYVADAARQAGYPLRKDARGFMDSAGGDDVRNGLEIFSLLPGMAWTPERIQHRFRSLKASEIAVPFNVLDEEPPRSSDMSLDSGGYGADAPWLRVDYPNRELQEFVRKNNIHKIRIAEWEDPRKGVDWLLDCRDDIRQLKIETKLRNLGPISQLRNLECLEFNDAGEAVHQIDFSELRRLRQLTIRSTPLPRVMGNLPLLQQLSLIGVNLQSLEIWSGLTALESLSMRQVKLASWRGLGHLSSLRTLSLSEMLIAKTKQAEELERKFGPLDLISLTNRAKKDAEIDLDLPMLRAGAEKAESQKDADSALARHGILLLLDQSGSMDGPIGIDMDDRSKKVIMTRAAAAAEAVNTFLEELASHSDAKAWDVGIIGYEEDTEGLLPRSVISSGLVAAQEIASLRRPGLDSGSKEWVVAKASGETRLAEAMDVARNVLERWKSENADSPLPIVVHVTDAPPKDRFVEKAALKLRSKALLFNIVMRGLFGRPQFCPAENPEHHLYGQSSTLPARIKRNLNSDGYAVADASRGFVGMAAGKELLALLRGIVGIPSGEIKMPEAASQPVPAEEPESTPSADLPAATTELDRDSVISAREFRLEDGSSSKFWRITLTGAGYLIRFGRIGTSGVEQLKDFDSADAARSAHDKIVAEKIRKGYVEVSAEPIDMTREQFWSLIERSRKGAGDADEVADRLEELLAKQETSQILAFDRHFHECADEAYRQDLWGVAYLIHGGCSDDGFDYFIGWLIAQGQKYFNDALVNPESAARRAQPGEYQECEAIYYAAANAYEARAGRKDFHERAVRIVRQLKGPPFLEDELEALYPKLAKKFGEA